MGLTAQAVQLVTQVGTAGVGLAGAVTESRAQKAQAEFEEQALKSQAEFTGRRAAGARSRGQIAESRARQQVRSLRGAQRASLGAQGIDIESGSAAEVQLETEALGAIDVATIRRNARLEALGLELERGDLLTRARLARIGGRVKARGTLTTGGLKFVRGVGGAVREFGENPQFFKEAKKSGRGVFVGLPRGPQRQPLPRGRKRRTPSAPLAIPFISRSRR